MPLPKLSLPPERVGRSREHPRLGRSAMNLEVCDLVFAAPTRPSPESPCRFLRIGLRKILEAVSDYAR